MMFDGTPTDAPKVGPTMPPAFNLDEFARDSSRGRGLVLTGDTVLEVVPNVSLSASALDLVELNVVRQVDGISPLWLLETQVAMARDELEVMLAMLMVRGIVRAVREEPATAAREPEGPASGVFGRAEPILASEDDLLTGTG